MCIRDSPFADHGALLDPPTADLTARCLSMLAQLGERPATSEPMRRSIEWLKRDQHPEGSWYGRWGLNYIYGTWSVLCLSLIHISEPTRLGMISYAVFCLKKKKKKKKNNQNLSNKKNSKKHKKKKNLN